MFRILVADDNETMLGFLNTLLELEGNQAITVMTIEEIIPRVRQEEPDLILMDVNIGSAQTLDTLGALKRDPALRSIPVLMTSGQELRDQCRARGAESFILKPFRPAALLKQMDLLLSQRDHSTNNSAT